MPVGGTEPLKEAALQQAEVKSCNPFLFCSDTWSVHPVILLALVNFHSLFLCIFPSSPLSNLILNFSVAFLNICDRSCYLNFSHLCLPAHSKLNFNTQVRCIPVNYLKVFQKHFALEYQIIIEPSCKNQIIWYNENIIIVYLSCNQNCCCALLLWLCTPTYPPAKHHTAVHRKATLKKDDLHSMFYNNCSQFKYVWSLFILVITIHELKVINICTVIELGVFHLLWIKSTKRKEL